MNKAAVSIPVFCQTHGISRAHFYNLMKRGKAPRTLLVGRRRLVSEQAAADWRISMEDSSRSVACL